MGRADGVPPASPVSPAVLGTSAIRVLVVDDSVVVRRVLGRAFETEPGMELAGTARNGRVALDRVRELRPDVMILDLEMPEMDGFETLRRISATDPALPVIVLTNHSERGVSATLDALKLGAADFVLKPRAEASGAFGEDFVRDQLFPRVRALVPGRRRAPSGGPGTGWGTVPVPKAARTAPVSVAPRASAYLKPVTAVVIVTSTGGPNALAEVMAQVPGHLPVPILIVQHMPPRFTRMLAERLDRLSDAVVVEAADGDEVCPGHVYIAPGGHHLGVQRRLGTGHDGVFTVVHDEPPENSCRPAGDVLFRSAARAWGSSLLAVVMTGMGQDGLRGAEAVRAAGGWVLAQSEATAVVASMPAAVAAAGLADEVVPLPEIAGRLVARIRGAVEA
jgi:two-component system chemotaxis response regulator CheB